MKTSIKLLFLVLCLSTAVSAQVKIGENPQNINPSSVLELESTDKVLVITRVTTVQMNAITPSAGALCYNTDLQSVHYYDGTQWLNIGGAAGGSGGPLSADAIVNAQPTIVITPTATGSNFEVLPGSIGRDQITNGGVGEAEIQGGAIVSEKIRNGAVTREKLSENSVGALALDNANINLSDFTNDQGFITAADLNSVSADTPNAISAGSDGGAFYDDTNLIGDIMDNTDALDAHIAADNDTSPANEIQNLEYDAANSLLGLSGTASTVDLGAIINSGGGSDDQTLSLVGNEISIEDGNTIDLTPILGTGGGTDDQTLLLIGNEISIEDGNTIDLTPILGTGGGSDDQTLSLVGNEISIEDGNTIDLTPILGTGGGTDDQTLSLVGNEISIEDGNTIDLTPILGAGGSDDQTAAEVNYDNTISLLTATTTQAAIDEIAAAGGSDDQTAAEVNYDNTISLLTATTTQAAIDEIAAAGGSDDQTAAEVNYDNTISLLTATTTQAAIDEIAAAGGSDDQTAAEVNYDNTTSLLTATTTQAAIDEIVAAGGSDDQTAAEVNYDNTTSLLTATTTQAAIDEIAAAGGTDDQTAAEVTYDNTTSLLIATTTQAAIDEIAAAGGSDDQNAAEVTYDNTTSLLTATTTQAAIDEIAAVGGTDDQTAAEVNYDNTTSLLTATTTQAAIDEIVAAGGSDDQTAAEVNYDNTTSLLTATTTQAAIDEIAAAGGSDDQTAEEVTYDNTTSLLTATTTQAAIDEIAAAGGSDDQTAAEVNYDNSTSLLTATTTQAAIDEIVAAGGTDDQTAAEVNYDNTTSLLTATSTQAAIDEIAAAGGSDDQTAAEVTYDNTTSLLTATTTQAAIDEIAAVNSATPNQIFFAAETTGLPTGSNELIWNPNAINGAFPALGIGIDALGVQSAKAKVHIMENYPLTSDPISYGLQLQNRSTTNGTAVGMIFSVDNWTTSYGKGGLVFERTGDWAVGDFHFLQNSATGAGTDINPTLADKAFTITKDKDLGIYRAIGIGPTGTDFGLNNQVLASGGPGAPVKWVNNGGLPTGTADNQVIKWNNTTSTWELGDDNTGTPNLASSNIFVGNGSGVATSRPLTGDASIDNVGVLTIETNAIENAMLDKTNIPLSGFGAATANLDLGTTFRITNLADPTADQEAATKKYVDDNAGANLFTTNLTLAANRTHDLNGNDLVIGGTGNIGIGNSANPPQNKLHVAGAIRSEGILNSDGTVDIPAYRFSGDIDTGMYWSAADELGFSVGGQEALIIKETVANGLESISNGSLELKEQLLDVNGQPGTPGQVLSSTATGTDWVAPSGPSQKGKVLAASGTSGTYTIPVIGQTTNDYIINTTVNAGSSGNIYIMQVVTQNITDFTVHIYRLDTATGSFIPDNADWFYTIFNP